MKAKVEFIEKIFSTLNEQRIHYCILRNSEEVQNGDAHDIDLSVDERDLIAFEQSLFQSAKELGWTLHLLTGSAKDRFNIKCYHFYMSSGNEISIVHFDVFPTIIWKGYILLGNNILMDNIDCSSKYHRVSREVEAVTKLFVRLIYNGKVKNKYKEYIKDVFAESGEKCKSLMQLFLEKDLSSKIYVDVIAEQWTIIENTREACIRSIKRLCKTKKIQYLRYLIDKLNTKPGLMVVFEGTDGSGKSTIIENLPIVLENTFPRDMIDYYHWRPAFIKKERKNKDGTPIVVSDPHGQKPYGYIKSFLKFMFFNLDYIIGYYMKINLQVAKGHLVVFDRYYYDYYLDKIRYRLKISDKVITTFGKIIPKPDITFLLVGTPEVLYGRKKEISISEIKSQIDSIFRNKANFSNPCIINVDQSIQSVVKTVSLMILEQCSMNVHKVKEKK